MNLVWNSAQTRNLTRAPNGADRPGGTRTDGNVGIGREPAVQDVPLPRYRTSYSDA